MTGIDCTSCYRLVFLQSELYFLQGLKAGFAKFACSVTFDFIFVLCFSASNQELLKNLQRKESEMKILHGKLPVNSLCVFSAFVLALYN